MLPLSPRKILAGWKLNRRNAPVTPAKANEMAAQSESPWRMKATKNPTEAIIVIQHANPSKPSSKFIALTNAMRHKIVIGMLKYQIGK